MILDLVKHDMEAARSLYGDVWLGFTQVDLLTLLRSVGFENIDLAVLDRTEEAPNFETVMAIGIKPKSF